ncbi:MAG: hypothetical protein E6J41_03765 [Chloroflexi bacterium]|nr:MAG: hypothetical protein E6J41_03765 [Chloroflexota bacterium]
MREARSDMGVTVHTENETAGAVSWGEWRVLIDQARDAALTLVMATDAGVHGDYRPTAAEIENAHEVMAQWRAVSARAMPDNGPQFVSRTASARMRIHRSAPVVIRQSADWCP